MNMQSWKCIVCVAILAISPLSATAQEDRIDFVTGVGLVISPDYNDVLDDAYSNSEVSGGYGWLDLQFGVRVNATEQFSITPGLDLLVNGGAGDVSFVNTIVLPSVSVQYAFTKESSLYLRGEANYGIPNIGADFEAESGGVGFGGAIGWTFVKGGVNLELGYLHIPVDIEAFRGLRSSALGDKNFGGARIKVSFSF